MQRSRFVERLRAFSKTPSFFFIVGAALGAIFFIYLYGLGSLNVSNLGYVLNVGGDAIQHQLGWEYYRDAAWSFPIGSIDGLASLYQTSVTLTDSIPIFAIFFKLISFMLPDSFQYIGIWTLVCYLLQGGFAALIFKKFTDSKAVAFLGTTFLIVSPMIIARAFTHESLAGQWIILLAIWQLLSFRNNDNFVKQTIGWTLTLVVAVMVHPYFLPMAGLIMLISVIQNHSSWSRTLLKAGIPAVVSVVTFWAIGGLMGHGTESPVWDIVNGNYNADILSLVNPIISSAFVKQIAASPFDNSENLNYLGLGIILLIPVIFALWTIDMARAKKKLSDLWSSLKHSSTKRKILIIGLVSAMIIVAMGEPIRFAGKQLFTIPTPHFVESIWAMFRSNGRLLWPITYIVAISTIVFFIKYFSKKRFKSVYLAVFLLPFAIIQVVDIALAPMAISKSSIIKEGTSSKYRLTDAQRQLMKNNFCNYQQVIFIDGNGEASSEDGIWKQMARLIFVEPDCHPAFNAGDLAAHPAGVDEQQSLVRETIDRGEAQDILKTGLLLVSTKEFVSDIIKHCSVTEPLSLSEYRIVKYCK